VGQRSFSGCCSVEHNWRINPLGQAGFRLLRMPRGCNTTAHMLFFKRPETIAFMCSEVVALELVRRLASASAAVSARLALPDSGGIELRLDAVPTLLNADLPGTKCARIAGQAVYTFNMGACQTRHGSEPRAQ